MTGRPVQPLGRTNEVFPSYWFRLAPLTDWDAYEALPEGAVVDVSSSPARHGHGLRDRKDVKMVVRTGFEAEQTGPGPTAAYLTTASLLTTLCCIGRSSLDVVFLSLRRALEPRQVDGVLAALEEARGHGLCRFMGIHLAGPTFAVMPTWRLHDAFELALVTRAEGREQIETLAAQKRVGVVYDGGEYSLSGPDRPLVVAVGSADEVRRVRELI